MDIVNFYFIKKIEINNITNHYVFYTNNNIMEHINNIIFKIKLNIDNINII